MYTVDECKEILKDIDVNDIRVTKHFSKRIKKRKLDISYKLTKYVTQPDTQIIKSKNFSNRFMLQFFCEPLHKNVEVVIAINESKQVVLLTIYEL